MKKDLLLNNKQMKIYFAGSISAGREDTHYYHAIIRLLEENHGDVLTEHIADHALSEEGEDLAPEVVHDRDLAWLRESDVLVGEVTIPSLGVGYEIGKATEWEKPVLLLHRAGGKKISAMVKGSKDIVCVEYSEIEEVPEILEEFFSQNPSQ